MPEKNYPIIVADTNVLVSALIGKELRNFPERLRDRQFELVFSEDTLEELFLAPERPKFAQYMTTQDIYEFRELLSFQSQIVVPIEKIAICRDAKDNIFLECAIVLPVDFLVSGDPDLLSLKSVRQIPIIAPADFLAKLK